VGGASRRQTTGNMETMGAGMGGPSKNPGKVGGATTRGRAGSRGQNHTSKREKLAEKMGEVWTPLCCTGPPVTGRWKMRAHDKAGSSKQRLAESKGGRGKLSSLSA